MCPFDYLYSQLFVNVKARIITYIRGYQTGGRDPFLCRQMFLKGCQSLPGLTYYLRFVVVCNTLGSQKFGKCLERVTIPKSLRTPGLHQSSIWCRGSNPWPLLLALKWWNFNLPDYNNIWFEYWKTFWEFIIYIYYLIPIKLHKWVDFLKTF